MAERRRLRSITHPQRARDLPRHRLPRRTCTRCGGRSLSSQTLTAAILRHWGSISVYRSGKQRPFRRIKPLTHGNVPVDPVLGPPANSTSSLAKRFWSSHRAARKSSRTIRKGLDFPTSLTFDSNCILYIVNQQSSTITEYAPRSVDVLRTIPRVKAYPYSLAFGP